jgi:hypothetical protein
MMKSVTLGGWGKKGDETKGAITTMKFLVVVVVALMLLPVACSPKAKDWDPQKIQVKWEGEVRKIIKDPERAEKVVALGVQVEMKNRTVYEEISRLKQEIRDVNRSYDSTREDYERALAKFTEKKNEALRQYLDSLFAMRQQTTPEEWKALMR